jgi:ubiquinone biosynthesis protein COQ4
MLVLVFRVLSLGRCHEFCRFSPDERAEVCFVDDPELAYVMQRYREIHDYLHALTGLAPTVLDEITLKWFEMVQTELPLCALSSFIGPLRLLPTQQWSLVTKGIPWATSAGSKAAFMMNVYFEKHFTESLDELRARLRVPKAPALS